MMPEMAKEKEKKTKNIYESDEENKGQQRHTETHKTMTKLIQ